MTVLLIALYIASFGFGAAGAVLLITDIVKDQRELRELLESRSAAEQNSTIEMAGGTMGGQFGALMAQSLGKQNIMDEHTLNRLRTGFGKRWLAVALIIVGVVLSLATDILGVLKG